MFSLTPGALESESRAEKNMEAVGWSTICMHVRDVSRVTTGHGASGSDGFCFFFKVMEGGFLCSYVAIKQESSIHFFFYFCLIFRRLQDFQ